MAVRFSVRRLSNDCSPSDIAQRCGWRLFECRFVGGGKPSQLVEPIAGRDGRDRGRPGSRVAERPPDALETLGQHPPLGTHTMYAIERVAQTPFTETDDATQTEDRYGGIDVRPQVGLGAANSLLPRRGRGGVLP